MPTTIQKAARIGGYGLISFMAFLVVYAGAALVIPRIPVAKADPNAPADVTVYLHTNGVHTDIVLPVVSPEFDWRPLLPYANLPSQDSSLPYIGFGWGDKGFYLDTPTWAELKLSTALKAAFWLGSAAMHTTYFRTMTPGPETIELHLSRAEYARLIDYIRTSFRQDAQGRFEHIKGHSYGRDDAFYEAPRVYSFLYTCNTWTNNALKASGQRACLWTPTDKGMFNIYGH